MLQRCWYSSTRGGGHLPGTRTSTKGAFSFPLFSSDPSHPVVGVFLPLSRLFLGLPFSAAFLAQRLTLSSSSHSLCSLSVHVPFLFLIAQSSSTLFTSLSSLLFLLSVLLSTLTHSVLFLVSFSFRCLLLLFIMSLSSPDFSHSPLALHSHLLHRLPPSLFLVCYHRDFSWSVLSLSIFISSSLHITLSSSFQYFSLCFLVSLSSLILSFYLDLFSICYFHFSSFLFHSLLSLS